MQNVLDVLILLAFRFAGVRVSLWTTEFSSNLEVSIIVPATEFPGDMLRRASWPGGADLGNGANIFPFVVHYLFRFAW